jgi:hypothetical protein
MDRGLWNFAECVSVIWWPLFLFTDVQKGLRATVMRCEPSAEETVCAIGDQLTQRPKQWLTRSHFDWLAQMASSLEHFEAVRLAYLGLSRLISSHRILFILPVEHYSFYQPNTLFRTPSVHKCTLNITNNIYEWRYYMLAAAKTSRKNINEMREIKKICVS